VDECPQPNGLAGVSRSPRIPERVFAPHAETAEIDILPL